MISSIAPWSGEVNQKAAVPTHNATMAVLKKWVESGHPFFLTEVRRSFLFTARCS